MNKPEDWKIEFVYGYCTSDCNQNYQYSASSKIVFTTAALIFSMEPPTEAQKYYEGEEVSMEENKDTEEIEFHRDDILYLVISADRKTIITA